MIRAILSTNLFPYFFRWFKAQSKRGSNGGAFKTFSHCRGTVRFRGAVPPFRLTLKSRWYFSGLAVIAQVATLRNRRTVGRRGLRECPSRCKCWHGEGLQVSASLVVRETINGSRVKPSPLQGVVSSGRTAAKKDGLCTMDRQSTTTPQVVGSSPSALTRCAPTHQPRIVMAAGKDRHLRSVAQRLERRYYKPCVGCSNQSTLTTEGMSDTFYCLPP